MWPGADAGRHVVVESDEVGGDYGDRAVAVVEHQRLGVQVVMHPQRGGRRGGRSRTDQGQWGPGRRQLSGRA
ncbi:hypothetical protein MYX84_15780 [Acidobacteria bacterium AH-259-O06]|nr:hypothetical protein [Acidobacteria bacterium AH-259-O06]